MGRMYWLVELLLAILKQMCSANHTVSLTQSDLFTDKLLGIVKQHALEIAQLVKRWLLHFKSLRLTP